MFCRTQLQMAAAVGLVFSFSFIPATRSMMLHAQETAATLPTVTIRSNTRLVVVDAVVTDKKGQPVTGLKAEDFVLEENGKKQRIAFFTPPGHPGAPKSGAQPLPPGVLSNRPEFLKPAGVPTVLLLDAANSSFKDQAYGRWQMLKYVEEQSHAGMPTAVMTLSDHLHVLQEFTSDPEILATAIRNLHPQEQSQQRGASSRSTNFNGNEAPGPGLISATRISLAQAEVAGFQNLVTGYNLQVRTVVTINAMRELSRMLAGLPGRKNVIWVTSDFPFDLIPQDPNMSDAEMITERHGGGGRSTGVNASGSMVALPRQLHLEEIKQAESELASANIAIYPVDVGGLVSGMEGISAVHSSGLYADDLSQGSLRQTAGLQANQGSMEEVAAETGGKAYLNQNEISLAESQAASDDKASYALGYYPDNDKWDGRYRSIKIKLEKSDAHIRYRKGYYAIEPGGVIDRNNDHNANDHTYEAEVANALEVNAPATQVAFTAQAKTTDPGKMRVTFLVDAHTLSSEREEDGNGAKMNVGLFAAVYNSGGKMLGNRGIKVDRAFDAASYKQILDKGMMVLIDMDMPVGGTEIRLAVVDNKTGFIGTVSGAVGQ
ncbi:MAG: VWA domain-containing protein [Terriglobales bacterium]|jgi:VWFA-related protein